MVNFCVAKILKGLKTKVVEMYILSKLFKIVDYVIKIVYFCDEIGKNKRHIVKDILRKGELNEV